MARNGDRGPSAQQAAKAFGVDKMSPKTKSEVDEINRNLQRNYGKNLGKYLFPPRNGKKK